MDKSRRQALGQATRKSTYLFRVIEEAENEEDAHHTATDLPEPREASALTADKLEQAIQQLKEKLCEKPKDRLKKAVRQLRKDLLPRLENQFVLGYSVHQRPTDTKCLKPHLDHLKKALKEKKDPQKWILFSLR